MTTSQKKTKIDSNKIKSILSKPIFLNIVLLIVQIVIFFEVWMYFAQYWKAFTVFSYALSFILIIAVINQDSNVAYKITWIVPLAAFPIMGAGLFIILNLIPRAKQMTEIILEEKKKASKYMEKDMIQSKKNIDEFYETNRSMANLANFLHESCNYPTYTNTSIKYYKTGEMLFEAIKKDLRKAKKYIFMEFFILSEGRLIGELIEIFDDAIARGVKVNMIFDGMNEFKLSDGYIDFLRKKGMSVRIFSPVKPIVSTYQNNRDHRKIIVIDGEVAYTGGVNLADEYANYIERFGHWKDTGIRIVGDSVNSLLEMFLSMWNLTREIEENRLDYGKYLPIVHTNVENASPYVTPFDDTPNNDEMPAKNVLLHMLYHAQKEVLMSTPYLLVDNELFTGITYAAKRGVKVKIVIPGIPDKKIPYLVAKSYLPSFIKSGVEIYKYSKGFIHSKTYLVDEETVMTGTINLDYRSLYLHFENGVFIYDEKFAKEVKEDFEEIFAVSQKATEDDFYKMFFVNRFLSRFFRIFAPLM